MTNYIQLAIKYLQQNKRRSFITILGAAVTVTILYALLNTGWGYLLQSRQEIRESQDYEMVLFAETEEQIQSIINDPLVESAYIGQYYSYIAGEGRMYENALYVNTVNPYRIDSTFDTLTSRYNVNGRIHNELAWTYLQGSEGSEIVVLIYFSIMIAFIFAIIGVGMIRNSIQLCMFENIRDYGNLRCIGSSKAELKMIIFMQGMILELIGIAAGTILGTVVTSGLSVYARRLDWFHIEGGFHILPLLLILATFLIDLYFAMGENAKLVTRMTPVSAIRGEYRIRKERFRLREKSLTHRFVVKLLGVDGSYAFKNLMRSPGRFWRTVGAMVFGIAAAIILVTAVHSFQALIPSYGYYQMYIMNTWGMEESLSMIQASLPPQDFLQDMSSIPEFTEVKSDYQAGILVASPEELISHYSEEFLSAFQESDRDFMNEQLRLLQGSEDKESGTPLAYDEIIGATCVGYDKPELNRCKGVLLDGTWDISDSGIILVNRTKLPIMQEIGENTWTSVGVREVPIYDYKIGDSVRIIDMVEYHKRVDEALSQLSETYSAKRDAILQQDPNDKSLKAAKLGREYRREAICLVVDTWKQLMKEGCYKTYTIEGIISEDPNVTDEYSEVETTFLMTRDAYFDLTGTDDSTPTGFLYHMNRIPRRNMQVYVNDENNEMYFSYDKGMQYTMCEISSFMDVIPLFQQFRRYLVEIALIIVFILMVAVINMINATSSSLYLRRKEFAQLRVIGVSKPHLVKMVVLEGVIESVVASVIGILLGSIATYVIFLVLSGITIDSENPIQFYFPVVTAILAIVVSVLVVCGAIYVPIRRLGNDLSEDLKTGGD